MDALRNLGLLDYFDARRIVTYDDILDAEEQMSLAGKPISLGKPHPFAIFKAIYPQMGIETLASIDPGSRQHENVLFVGDTPSDVYAAKAAGVRCFGVVGAVRDEGAKEERTRQLIAAGCELVVESLRDLREIPDK